MPIEVRTTMGNIWIADDPEAFQIETNVPAPGWVRITCQNGKILWFNWNNVICVGDTSHVFDADTGRVA